MPVHSEKSGKNSLYLSALLSVSSDVFIFMSRDAEITELNGLAIKYFFNHHHVIGKTWVSLYSNKKIAMPFSQKEFKLLLKDKQYFIDSQLTDGHKNVYFRWSIIDLALDNSSDQGYLILGKNNTKQKRIDQLTQENQNQLIRIASCVPGNFYWKNTKAQYLGCNESLLKVLGFASMEDIIGKTDEDLWPEQAAWLYKNDRHVIESKETIFLEEKVSMPGKDDLYFTVTKMPLFDNDGHVIGILGNSLDITDLIKTKHSLEEANEKVEEANRAKDEFIQNMSHDIRTPLTGIVGISNLLELEAQSQQEKEHAHMVNVSGEQLLSLLNSVLDIVSAGSAKENILDTSSFDIYQLIYSIGDLELPTIKLKNLDLHIQIDDSVPQFIISDPTKLHRIILNLLGNSIKFTEKGSVTIGAKIKSQVNNAAVLEIIIVDTGIGIDADAQTKIFDRFFRVNPSHQGLFQGHGVGLHIVQKYTELLKGTISLESCPGKGTTFRVELPILIDSTKKNLKPQRPSLSNAKYSANNTAAPTETVVKKVSKSNDKAPLFLLVEDNFVALKIIESMIEKIDAHYISAMSGESAFELFKENNIDIVITDIGLPDISGNELTRKIRAYEQQELTTPVTIVGLTAHTRDAARTKSLQAGMNELFTKPLRDEVLNQLLHDLTRSTPKTDRIKIKHGLPKCDEEMFQLDSYMLFDREEALKNCGTDIILKQMLSLVYQELPADLKQMKKAFEAQDFVLVEKTAHKIKGGAVYVGTMRMKYACQYLEGSWKAGKNDLFQPLYHQAVTTIENTYTFIKNWLKQQKI